MPTPISDPAFYFIRYDGEVLSTTVQMPGQAHLKNAFFVFATMELASRYAQRSGKALVDYETGVFETVEDVERFVEQHKDRYEFFMINPEAGQPSPVQPFERLLEIAYKGAVED